MNSQHRQLALALILSAAAGGLVAQTGTGNTQSGAGTAGTGNATASGRSPAASSEDWQRIYRASKIIGTDVRNTRGEKIGDIKDLVLDRNGAISYAVVSTGGFLGIGDRLHAVPWNVIQTAPGRDYRVLDMDKNRLKNAPNFDPNNWPNVIDDQWGQDNRRFYQGGSPGTTNR